jgi:glycosyltransferase involved in cell wall biosynthesis
MVLPARHDLTPAPVSGVTFHPYRYAPHRSLAVFGYAEALRADVAVRRSTYLVAPLAIVSGAAKMATLVRRGGFDVIHAHWVVPSGAMALPAGWLSGLPLVVSLHGSDVFLSERGSAFRRAAAMAFRRAAAVTACSNDLAERSRRLGALTVPVTVPYGVSADEFGPSADRAMRLRSRLGLAPDSPVVLAVGRLVHKKGFEVLVDAIPRITQHYPDLSVVIAGEGDLRRSLEARANDLGTGGMIRFAGNVSREELPDYYSLATVVAVPSIRDDAGNVDGLPNVLLEAMASGSPLVASAVAGIPQAIRDGKDGVLVEERDPEALATAIVNLLGSPKRMEELGASARNRARQVFDWTRVGERFEKIFRSVAGAGGSTP